MSKKKIIGIIFIALMFSASICYAYMIKQTEYTNTELIPANISCEADVETDTGTNFISQKNSITVKNTGNVKAYIRVKLVSYWQLDGNISNKPSKDPEFALSGGWIAGPDNTYYCKQPIEPNEETVELLASPIYLTEEDGHVQVVEVFSEAIQSNPAEAAEDSWNVVIENEQISEIK